MPVGKVIKSPHLPYSQMDASSGRYWEILYAWG
jgi:hypothetical protein